MSFYAIPTLPHVIAVTVCAFVMVSESRANPEAANFSFPTDTRIGAQAGYYRHYIPSEGWEARMNWTGSIVGANPGTVSAAYFNDTLRRVNYYRAQAGLLADVTHNATKSAKCQWAALIFSCEDNISHTPAVDFPTNACYLADNAAHGLPAMPPNPQYFGRGHEAAGVGNLSLGSTGPDSIAALMVDSGSNNDAVGHRRWFLYPRQREVGFGGVPFAGTQNASACAWVLGDFKPASAALTKVVPWPNAGYIPFDQIPNAANTVAYGGQLRWSCGYTNGNFTNALVTMTRTSGAGAPASVAVTKEPYTNVVGDNSLVWRMNSASSLVRPTAGQDISYQVNITGITLTGGSKPAEFTATGGGNHSYSYTVTTFEPTHLPTAMTVLGSASPATGLVNTYSLNQLPESSGLKVTVGTVANAAWAEGAEDSPTPKVLDGTTNGYALRVNPSPSFTAAVGTKVFHLAFNSNPPVLQSFTVDRLFVPGASSKLQFRHRFGALGLGTSLHAEISTDGGGSWANLWTRAGNATTNGGFSEGAWQTGDVTVPATYTNKICKLRFSLLFASGNVFVGTSNGHGAFVDDVKVTASQEFTTVSTTELGSNATTYNFTPPSNANYWLQAQMELGDTRHFDFGPTTSVSSVAPTAMQTWRATNLGTATNSGAASDVADPDGDGLANVVEYAFGLDPAVAQATSVNLPAAVKSGANIVFTFKPAASAAGLTYTVQKSSTLANGSWTSVAASVSAGVYTATVPISDTKTYLRLKVDNTSGL